MAIPNVNVVWPDGIGVQGEKLSVLGGSVRVERCVYEWDRLHIGHVSPEPASEGAIGEAFRDAITIAYRPEYHHLPNGLGGKSLCDTVCANGGDVGRFSVRELANNIFKTESFTVKASDFDRTSFVWPSNRAPGEADRTQVAGSRHDTEPPPKTEPSPPPDPPLLDEGQVCAELSRVIQDHDAKHGFVKMSATIINDGGHRALLVWKAVNGVNVTVAIFHLLVASEATLMKRVEELIR